MRPDFVVAAERCPVISLTGEASRARLMPQARIVTYDRGQSIYVREAQANRCFVLLGGWVKLYRVRRNGDEALIRVQSEGDNFGFDECLRNERYRHNASAVTPCRLLVLPARVLRETLAADPDFGKVLLLHSFETADKLHDQIEALKSYKAIERLARFLHDHAKAKGTRMMVRLPFEKTTVAAYLGMQPESLSRALSKLAAHGVQASRDEIEIVDLAALEALIEETGTPVE